ncbi:CPCC family cysteine-rich protein [Streptomyces sp. NPDC085946]|uniref:CPCC family cysteine-rich protein n=1 Tax=Streptomyces sp. NPDC085946 TaxID=3365744 RepID=UPI0037D0DABC
MTCCPAPQKPHRKRTRSSGEQRGTVRPVQRPSWFQHSAASRADGSTGWAARPYRLVSGGDVRQHARMVTPFVNAQGEPEDGPYPCPCCGFLALGERSTFEICSVCFWEDDGQDGLTSPAGINVIGRRRIPAIGTGLRTAR